MLAIKLQRIGKKHQPSYRLVVAMKRSKMAGPPVEDLGSYNPFTKTATFKKERASYWIGVGAQPTVTAHNLLVKEGVVAGAKTAVKMKKVVIAPIVAEAAASATAPVVEISTVAAAEPVAEAPVASAEPAPTEEPTTNN
jgi:small subunit ribosomal protein S16